MNLFGRPSKRPLARAGDQPLLRPFRDEIPLDLGEQPEQTTITLVCMSCFPSKRIASLIAMKLGTFRFTSSSTIWITWLRLRPKRDSSLTTRRSPAAIVPSRSSIRGSHNHRNKNVR